MTFALGFFVFLSAGLWYVYVVAMHTFTPNFLPNASTMELFESPIFWATMVFITVVGLLPDFLWKFFRRQFFPHPYHIVQEFKFAKALEKGDSTHGGLVNLVFVNKNKEPRRSRGYSFSQSFGQSRVLKAYEQFPKVSNSLSKT